MEESTIQLLNSYDISIKSLDITNKNITGLLDLKRFNKLKKLICSHNKITEIINIPKTLKYFDCSYNIIEELIEISGDLEYFNCKKNPLIKLYYPFNIKPKSYPETLKYLSFGDNFNHTINNLPNSITNLTFGRYSKFNQYIDNLPTTITNIIFNNTNIPHSEIINCFNQKDCKKEIICYDEQFYYIIQLYHSKKKLKKINFTIKIKYDSNIRGLLSNTNYHEDCYFKGYDNCNKKDYIGCDVNDLSYFSILLDGHEDKNEDEMEELISAYIYEDFEHLESEIVKLLSEKYKNYKLNIKFNQK